MSSAAGQPDARPSREYPYPAIFHAALDFALARHRGQMRKGTGIPYITHPVIVAETLSYHYPESHELIVAGVLHDVIEDTDSTYEEVEQEFGRVVADLVLAVSKPASAPAASSEQVSKVERWVSQRKAMIESMSKKGDDVLRLKAADTLANLRAIRRDLDAGDSVWDRFKVGREHSLWYYGQVFDNVRALGDEPIVRELQSALQAVS